MDEELVAFIREWMDNHATDGDLGGLIGATEHYFDMSIDVTTFYDALLVALRERREGRSNPRFTNHR